MATIYQTLEPEQAEYLSTNFPGFIRNGTIPVSALAFDAAADEAAFWKIDVTGYSAGSLSVDLYWGADTATTNNVIWGGAVACITAGTDTQDMTTKTLAAESTVTGSHLGTTARRLMKTTLTIAALDSITSGDAVFIRIRRLGSSAAADTMAGDAWLERAVVSYTA